MNYTYRIYPDAVQQTELRSWLETCRGLYNYALRELKDWIASRRCPVDRCSLAKEYIIPADESFPSYLKMCKEDSHYKASPSRVTEGNGGRAF
ncbi:helix-turn-helix domain-containing protein [Spirulina major CS-329]|nr:MULTISPECIES: helix-turn-helix domain-containing protein [Spirulina]MDB9495733.1 helix-turn-helix domain-containing protein [Spirulina subsalsa CS-330]MDB9505088.1 helix-turn-helix domain-containing protein [Spirulina major CS-329]